LRRVEADPMTSFTQWCLILGPLLIFMGLSDTLRARLPFSSAALYLLAGALLGPHAFGLIDVSLPRDAAVVEVLTEIAVLISLFAVGLRLRATVHDRLWIVPLRLATLGMLATIGALVAVGLALGLPLGWAVLLGAVLAPTDPVLASEVQVRNVDDRDRLRFALSAEGGLNDGAAFPFVMLALGLIGVHELGDFGWRWWSVDVLWATAGGLALGWGCGHAFARVVVFLRHDRAQALGMESFLTLGLIALTYGAALATATYGFLAVFAAGLAVRHVEHSIAGFRPARDAAIGEAGRPTPDEPSAPRNPQEASATMARAVLDFTLDLERLAELAVMLLIGSLLSPEAFSAKTLAVAAALLFVARPLSIYLSTSGRRLSPAQRRLAAWFGIRGIGSMYYLAYAVGHDASGPPAEFVTDAVLVTIAVSVVLHGSSATPIMALYRRARSPGR
jgi:NhaP-type Na+/H+ or K+/H+ antiporter